MSIIVSEVLETVKKQGRTVAGIVNSIQTLEGGGFLVRRPFPKSSFSDFDPFLLLDEMGPMDVGPGEAKGAPEHPHRGFETVTYMLSGEMEHKDSAGHAGKLTSGDVQWMTAGAGVIHAEMPSEEFLRTGGRMHGFQLWVNLPRVDKMMKPRYQEIPNNRIPQATSADGLVSVSVIAGEALGAKDGDEVRIDNSDGTEELEVLLIGGAPLNEPIARYGPFVMNTEAEIRQAFEDYRLGLLGSY
jgi:redox-sensitive bicupin YhaK (pirin superfamily)